MVPDRQQKLDFNVEYNPKGRGEELESTDFFHYRGSMTIGTPRYDRERKESGVGGEGFIRGIIQDDFTRLSRYRKDTLGTDYLQGQDRLKYTNRFRKDFPSKLQNPLKEMERRKLETKKDE